MANLKYVFYSSAGWDVFVKNVSFELSEGFFVFLCFQAFVNVKHHTVWENCGDAVVGVNFIIYLVGH